MIALRCGIIADSHYHFLPAQDLLVELCGDVDKSVQRFVCRIDEIENVDRIWLPKRLCSVPKEAGLKCLLGQSCSDLLRAICLATGSSTTPKGIFDSLFLVSSSRVIHFLFSGFFSAVALMTCSHTSKGHKGTPSWAAEQERCFVCSSHLA